MKTAKNILNCKQNHPYPSKFMRKFHFLNSKKIKKYKDNIFSLPPGQNPILPFPMHPDSDSKFNIQEEKFSVSKKIETHQSKFQLNRKCRKKVYKTQKCISSNNQNLQIPDEFINKIHQINPQKTLSTRNTNQNRYLFQKNNKQLRTWAWKRTTCSCQSWTAPRASS